MKIGLLLFFAGVLLALFFIVRSHPMLITVTKNFVQIRYRDCNVSLPVHIEHKENDMVDELAIERLVVRLPNGQKMVIEQDDLSLKHKFGVAYNALMEEIFQKKMHEVVSIDGMVIYKADTFYVALFYKSRSSLVLLYPLDESFVQSLRTCIEIKKFSLSKKFQQLPLLCTKWSMKQIILDGLIEKNI